MEAWGVGVGEGVDLEALGTEVDLVALGDLVVLGVVLAVLVTLVVLVVVLVVLVAVLGVALVVEGFLADLVVDFLLVVDLELLEEEVTFLE